MFNIIASSSNFFATRLLGIFWNNLIVTLINKNLLSCSNLGQTEVIYSDLNKSKWPCRHFVSCLAHVVCPCNVILNFGISPFTGINLKIHAEYFWANSNAHLSESQINMISIQFFTIRVSVRSDRSWSGFLLLAIVCVNYLIKYTQSSTHWKY